MDELDLILDDLGGDSTEALMVVEHESEPESDVMVAMEEFQNATNPKDRLEALKLLIQLAK